MKGMMKARAKIPEKVSSVLGLVPNCQEISTCGEVKNRILCISYGILAHLIFIDLIWKVKSIIKTNDDRGKHVRGCYDYQMTITLGDLFFGGFAK